jgi:ABC-2 type transport system permease protein
MMRYLRVFAVQLRTSLASAMAYRANFVVEGVMSVAWVALTLLPLIVLFDNRTSVAGWDKWSALIVIGYFTSVNAVVSGLITPSLADLVEKIRTGSFDYVLLKPVDAQAMISASRYQPWRIFDALAGIGLVIYALVQRAAPPPSLGDAALGVLLFGTGVLATYAIWIVCAAASFWVVRLDNLMYLLDAIFDTGRWPVQVFPGVWRFFFTFVIPVAIMTTYPAMALLHQLDATTALATAGGSLLLLAVSRLVWRTAIRSYTSASS